jgi:hypothetical protein
MKVTQKTRIYTILKEFGDVADIMEIFGVKRVGNFAFRKIITRAITVRMAAFVHRVPKDKFLGMIQAAVDQKMS